MKYLSAKCDQVLKYQSSIKGWIDDKHKQINQEVDRENKDPYFTGQIPALTILFILLLMVFHFIALVFYEGGVVFGKSLPTLYWGLLFLITVMPITEWFIYFSRKKSNKVRARAARLSLEYELKLNPLYVRAELLVRALNEYRVLCKKYRALFKAVDEGWEELSEAKENEADRYHAMVMDRCVGLTKSVDNFQKVAELARRQEVFKTEHPELSDSSEDTALAALMEQLNQPVKIPPELAMSDPLVTLRHEETLVNLIREMNDEEAHRQLDELEESSKLIASELARSESSERAIAELEVTLSQDGGIPGSPIRIIRLKK